MKNYNLSNLPEGRKNGGEKMPLAKKSTKKKGTSKKEM